jgi:hypothetical protein
MGSKTGIGIATGIPFINKRKGGSGVQPLPPDLLDVLVGVWIADQNNNDSSNRDSIKNKIPNAGGDFELLNFAYKLNSGFGKYEEDFTQRPPWYAYPGVNVTPNKISLNSNFRPSEAWIVYKAINNPLNDFKVKVTGIPDGGTLYFYLTGISNKNIKLVNGNNDIKFDIPTTLGSSGFRIENPNLDWSKLVIEQIPSFQGALVTDGVDDLITSTKTAQEMLGGSTEITVVSMINSIIPYRLQLSYTNAFPINRTNAAPLRNEVSNTGKTGIYGYTYKNNVVSVINNVLGDKNDYTAAITGEPQVDDRFEVTRTKFNSSVAWYWTFIAKKALTTDQINQVIAYYNLDKYVKPDIYYDVKRQGLSNNTPDTDWYLKDFSGNGRDMQLYNYGKTPESGINEEGGLQSDGVTDYGQYVGDLGLKGYTVAVDRAYPSLKGNGVPIISGINNDTATPFLFEFIDNTGIVRPYSFGAANVLSTILQSSRKISYQSTYIYDSTAINKGTIVDTGSGLTIGRFGGDQQYSNFALWSLLLFPYSLSEFLLERQLKRYKLGTLYPDMVEFRPIITGNVPYKSVEIHQGGTILYSHLVNNTGTYISKDEPIRIFISANGTDIVSSITVNEVTKTDLKLNANGKYWANFPITKSPQKISYVIDEYVRYEDIVQSYPAVINLKQDGKAITWGDKLKVGSEVTFVNHTNLLPDLYTISGLVLYNGVSITWNTPIRVEKSMTFINFHNYKKANEPNCILAPQILRIPNASYKILGYIPDLTGKGNHGKINNSAYAGMSGANGYSEDFTAWLKSSGVKVDNDKIEINASSEMWLLRQYTTSTSKFKVNVVGIPNNGTLKYGTISNPQQLHNGVNELDAFSFDALTNIGFFKIGASANDWVGLIIQQIGQYEGSYCLDGVDDFITIPTLSHSAKQVLMKVNWNSINTIAYDHRNGVGSNDRFAIYLSDINEAIAYNARNSGQTYIDGILNTNIVASQLKDITHNITITNNDVNASNSGIPRIGSAYTNSLYTQMALFSFMSFDDISSEDEIKELNDIVGIEGGYVESPDYYWDAYGKANRATKDIDYLDLNQASNANQVLIDKSKAGLAALELYHNTGNTTELNNRRLVANNFAFNEESGYIDNGLVSDGVDDHLINGIIPAFTDFTVIAKRISKADIDGTMFVIKGKDGTITNAAFGLEYKNVNSNYTYSFGASTKIESIPNLITWCTPTNYNGQVLTKGNVLDANGIQIGKFASRYWKGVFYKMMLYSKTIDQLSINMLKNLFERDELINVKHPIFKNENSTSQST